MQEIICILDGSGSMGPIREEAKGAFNQFIEEQQKIDIPANITITWFDSVVQVGTTCNLKDIKPLDEWRVGSMTALNDAIGITIKSVAERFGEEKPEKVIMAIITDGFENMSQEFKSSQVKALVQKHESKYGWEVIYLACDQDAVFEANKLGIKASNSINFNKANIKDGVNDYSKTVAAYRSN